MTEPKELLEARIAFEAGDFKRVRKLTAELAKSLDPEVRKQAAALASRVGIDPVAVIVVVLSVAFFVAVCLRYFGAR